MMHLVLLTGKPSCDGDWHQFSSWLFTEDLLKQHEDVCRLWGGLQQNRQATIPTDTELDIEVNEELP
jgi:hypothetical protein